MYLKKYENVEIILNNNRALRWEKLYGIKPEINKPFLVHWSLLKSKKKERLRFIKVMCDDCKIIFERRIRDLDLQNNFHLCNSCRKKGDRNGAFGKPCNEKTKEGLKKWMEENGNPFTWDITKKILKEKQEETVKKIIKKTTGLKRSDETRKKISIGIINAYKNGKKSPSNGYCNLRIKQYKGIDYQGSYELRFLKFIDDIGKLSMIEKGPTVIYIFDNIEHSYFIDFKIKDTNIVFEIKSTYYWKKHEEINIIKKQEAEKLFQYNLIIDNNFKNIKKLFL